MWDNLWCSFFSGNPIRGLFLGVLFSSISYNFPPFTIRHVLHGFNEIIVARLFRFHFCSGSDYVSETTRILLHFFRVYSIVHKRSFVGP